MGIQFHTYPPRILGGNCVAGLCIQAVGSRTCIGGDGEKVLRVTSGYGGAIGVRAACIATGHGSTVGNVARGDSIVARVVRGGLEVLRASNGALVREAETKLVSAPSTEFTLLRELYATASRSCLRGHGVADVMGGCAAAGSEAKCGYN
jgi:hypothetical protein